MRLLPLAFLLFATPAMAQQPIPQTYDMTKPILDLSGNPVPDAASVDPAGKRATLTETYSSEIEHLLWGALPGDGPPPNNFGQAQLLTEDQARQQTARYYLAARIHDKPDATFTDKERLAVCRRAKQAREQISSLRIIQLLCPNDNDLTAEVQ